MACQKCEKTQVLTTWSFHRGGSTCARRAHDQRSVLLFWRTSRPPIKDSRLFTIYSWFILTITSTPTGHEFFELFFCLFLKKTFLFCFWWPSIDFASLVRLRLLYRNIESQHSASFRSVWFLPKNSKDKMARVNVRRSGFWHSLMAVVFVASMLVSLVHAGGPVTNKNTARNFKIVNNAGARIEIYWMNVSGVFRFGGKLV